MKRLGIKAIFEGGETEVWKGGGLTFERTIDDLYTLSDAEGETIALIRHPQMVTYLLKAETDDDD